MNESDQITQLLKNAKTIAVIGLSNSPLRPAYGVSAYMQSRGYRIIPVHPEAEEVLGQKAYKSLLDIPEQVDIVDVFRRSDAVGPIVDEAIRKGGVKAVWMQETVVNEDAARKAREAGLFVVMDLCILKEHRART